MEDMHSKTRYNIRLAERKGVEVKEDKDLDVFYKLYQETEQRGDFSGHNRGYFEKMLQLDNVYQLIAYYESQPLASNILIKSGRTMTYLHGGSTREHRDVMATYRVQWKGLQLAKDLDCSYYDFWGSAPVFEEQEIDDMSGYDKSFGKCWPKKDELSGVTRFKVRFNPGPVSYPQAKDVVFSPLSYQIYSTARQVRRFM
ncbi:MAG: lipid II:glycine glycyltransferase FemX [Candidatus Paceibacteria bacterium]